MSSTSNIKVRRAKLGDYQGVMDIGIMYSGYDYVPYFYGKFLEDPDYMSYVCELDGEIVGYQTVLINDGGRVMQGRAGRVKTEHRGKGCNKALYQAAKQDAQRLPLVESEVFVVGQDTVALDASIKLISKTNFVRFTVYLPDKSRMNYSGVVPLREVDIRTLLQSPSVCKTLFPRDLIYVDFLHLGIDPSNARHIVNDNTRLFATLRNPTVSRNHTSKQFEPADITLLTLGFSHPTYNGHRCSISIYGKDFQKLEDHIKAHLSEVEQSILKICLVIYTQDDFPREVVERIYRTYGEAEDDGLKAFNLCTIRTKFETNSVKSKY